MEPETPPASQDQQALTSMRRGLLLLVAFAAVFVLEWAQAFFVPLAFALLLTFCLNPLVSRLRRLHVPRSLGAALAVLTFVAVTLGALLSVQDDARELLTQLPASTRAFRRMLIEAASDRDGWWHRLNLVARSAGVTPAATSVSPIPTVTNDLGATLLQGYRGAAAFLGQVAVVLFLVYFLLVARLPVAPTSRVITMEILQKIAVQVQRYIGVLVVTNIALALLTWLAFALIGIKYAAVWGLAAGLLHFVPYVGPAVIAAASALAATVQFESLGSGLVTAAVSLTLSTIIGIALTTWLTGKAARMNSAALFVGLLFWGWLWGLPGLLLGAPMMMTLKVISEHVTALAWLARALHHDPRMI